MKGHLSLSDDRQKPRFHITAPQGWLNDPNGIVRANGRYHVFYQHNPAAPRHADIHWGHASSEDLVTWQDEPVALRPRPGEADSYGCWTGVVTEENGTYVAVYSAVEDRSGASVVLLARSDDGLTSWAQDTEPAAKMPDDPDVIAMRDPYLFRYEGRRYAVLGAGLTGDRPAVLLYDCEQLDEWRYLGPLLTGDDPIAAGYAPAHIWECPQLVQLDGRWVLIVSQWHRDDAAHRLRGVRYLLGDLVPEGNGLRLAVSDGGAVDAGPDFYAPQAVEIDGGVLQWGWSWEHRDQSQVDAAGWAGTLTWPRELTLVDGQLWSRPAEELRRLRGRTLPISEADAAWYASCIPRSEELRLTVIQPDGNPVLRVDVNASGNGWNARWGTEAAGRWQSGDAEIGIAFDGSILEAYCGALPPITQRVYPSGPGWSFQIEGDAALTVWELGPPSLE